MPDLHRQGARVHFDVTGEGPPVLLLHGFTLQGDALSVLTAALAPRYACVTMDLLGHGGSSGPEDPERYRLEELALDAVAVMDRLGHERFALFGYSLGGRVAMRLALRHRPRIAALILESASPGIEDPREREARQRADDALAEEILRQGVGWFAGHWENIPLFATQRTLSAETRARVREGRLRQSAGGLALSLRGAGAGRDPDVWQRIGDLPGPLLLLAGAEDPKYAAIAARMAAIHPDARLRILEGAGHTAHLERPDAVREAVRGFLDASPLAH